ncbi:hypothetical protein ASE77_18800 [Sphingomonas sp. Leaf226]|nr:hypothetical protein [Sphingomonas sp. Leaf226]KQM96344.1 hypothetical protein ASE77_18800 [Sphingomonas sp. Leaf226]
MRQEDRGRLAIISSACARLQSHFLRLALGDHRPQRRAGDAGQQVLVQIIEFGGDLLQVLLRGVMPARVLACQSLQFTLELFYEHAHMLVGQQMLLEDRQGGGLQWTFAYRHAVSARAALLLPRAAVIVLAADRVIGTATAAADKAGEQMPRAGLACRRGCLWRTLAALNLGVRRVEQRVVNDA